MKTKFNIFCLFAIFVLLMASCDDFLDIKPKGKIIPETAVDYERLLNSYNILKASKVYPIYMTDDAYVPEKQADNNILGLDQVDDYIKNLYTFQSEIFSEANPDELWKNSYSSIYTYNTIILNILDAARASEAEKQAIRAEALVGRALDYLFLINAYAKHYDSKTAEIDLGVPLILDNDINKNNLKRATVKEVYDQIEKDLTHAIEYLPENFKNSAFRASKSAALGILARMYLYQGNYKNALENANAVLNKNNVLLDLKQYNIVEGKISLGRIDVPTGEFSPENIYLRYAPRVFAPSGSIFISKDLQRLYNKENDKRFLLYITDKPYYPYYPPLNNEYAWLPFLRSNMAITTPEMYLTAAECEARIGSKDRAMELINTLRNNRIINNISLTADSKEDALVKVLEERRRELTMLGFTRLIDLKRLNKDPRFAKTIIHTAGSKTYTLEPNSPKYVLPIPREAIRFNPKMKQNKR